MALRYREGVLPERELRDHIREQIFARMALDARFVPIDRKEIPRCKRHCPRRIIAFGSYEACELTADEYRRLAIIDLHARQRLALPWIAEAKVSPRLHYGGCTNCRPEAIARKGALVTCEAFGFPFSREYAL